MLSQQGSYPYGEQWYQSGPGNKWLFTSYGRDSETGLDYALARYYDSRTGTFCSADPLAGDPSDPQSWNRYPYGRNNPIGNVDPSGKGWLSWLLDAGAIAAAIFAPQIDAFLGDEFGALFGGSEAATASADASYTPVLLTRGAATAATAAGGADGAAAVASGAGAGISAAAAAGAAATSNDDQPKKPNKLCNNAIAVGFVKLHMPDAAKIANQYQTSTANVLGLSARESGYGASSFTAGNAFFNLETTVARAGQTPVGLFAYSNGWMQAGQSVTTFVAKYPSY